MKKKEKIQWCAVVVVVLATAGILLARGKEPEETVRKWVARPETGTNYETVSVALEDIPGIDRKVRNPR